MSRIREKAAESEAIVRDITKDIQILDLAKKNLALSVTALKRFQMLGMSQFVLRFSVSNLLSSQRARPAGRPRQKQEIRRDCSNPSSMSVVPCDICFSNCDNSGSERNRNFLQTLLLH